MHFTDEELTVIYKQANDEVGKARPLTTASIFKAMRAIADEALERAAQHFDERGKIRRWELV